MNSFGPLQRCLERPGDEWSNWGERAGGRSAGWRDKSSDVAQGTSVWIGIEFCAARKTDMLSVPVVTGRKPRRGAPSRPQVLA